MEPGTRLGPYEIVAPIGAGGMGEVWRARDTRLGRDVALKVLPATFADDPDRLRRFEQEARATAALNHPNILAIFDIGTHEGQPYLVEELLEGESLRARMRGGALPVAKAVELAVQVAQGLAAAHEKGIVHRDLKPENLFLTKGGHLKILDFGLAKLARPDTAGRHVSEVPTHSVATEEGHVLGTVGYMAPEQVRGMACDHRVDVFAFGCVLYEMLSGQQAFRGETPADTISAILSKDPPPLSGPGRDVPPALQGIVRRCIEKRPEDRFSSAHDLALALAVTSGSDATVPTRAARSQERHLLAGAAIVAAVAVVALALWRPWRTMPHATIGAPPSVLALPCTVYGAPEVAFLTDAVPRTISALLSGVEGLDTKVPPTSFEVERVQGDLARLGELFEVSSFIVTSLTASPGRLALNVQLVDAGTRRARWGNQYEGPREAYNELAHQAAEGIRQALRPTTSRVPTSGISAEAELAFREGAYFSSRYITLSEQHDFEASLAAYTRALDLDPKLADAAAKIGGLLMARAERHGDLERGRKDDEAWARRALGIDPRCGLAWAELSYVELYAPKPDTERAIDYAVKAVAFAPRGAASTADITCTLALWVEKGSSALAIAPNLHAFELDPFQTSAGANASFFLSQLGRPEEALVVADRVLRVEPRRPHGSMARSVALLRLGRLAEAGRALQESEEAASATHINSELWRLIRLDLAVAQRDAATADALVQRILASALDARAEAWLVNNAALFAAPTLARMGRSDDAVRILVRSVEASVVPGYDWLLIDPGIELLRGDSRFATVLAASRDRATKVAGVLQNARVRGELPAYLEQPLDDLILLLRKT
jgi:tetratricopeptide (TPR) repeat protein